MSNTSVAAWVPAALVEPARNLASCIAATGEGMWATATSSTSQGGIEGYISSGVIASQFAALIITPEGETPEQLQQRAAVCLAAAAQGAAQQGKTLTAGIDDVIALLTDARTQVGNPYQLLSSIGQVLREPQEPEAE